MKCSLCAKEIDLLNDEIFYRDAEFIFCKECRKGPTGEPIRKTFVEECEEFQVAWRNLVFVFAKSIGVVWFVEWLSKVINRRRK